MFYGRKNPEQFESLAKAQEPKVIALCLFPLSSTSSLGQDFCCLLIYVLLCIPFCSVFQFDYQSSSKNKYSLIFTNHS